MTYKQIEAARERRLWLKDVIVPAVAIAASVWSVPEVRETVNRKWRELKMNIQTKRQNKK